MASIPGILGYVQPGAFSRLTFNFAGTGNPNGIRSVAIIGLGHREEYLVMHAAGNGTDGLPIVTSDTNNYNYATIGEGVEAPNGMNFQTTYYPIIKNQFKLYKNGKELIRSKDTVVADNPLFIPGTDYAVDFQTGKVLLAPAYAVTNTNGTDGYFEYVSVPANVPSETWTITAFDQPSPRATQFVVVGSKSGQIFGHEVFQEQRNYVFVNGAQLNAGGIYYLDSNGQRKAPPLTSFLRSDPAAYNAQGSIVLDIRRGAVVTVATVDGSGNPLTAYIDDPSVSFEDTMVSVGNFVEFVLQSDPNKGYLYEVVDVAPTGFPNRLVINVSANTSFSNFSPSGYIVVSSDQVGKNFYNRNIEVYGANKLSTSKKRYFIRILGSLPTDLSHSGEEAVYMTPGQALYETSDDYAYDERTGTWTGTWYRGPEGTGLLTNETTTGALGRHAAVPIYTSDGQFSGLTVNFAPPTGVPDFDSLTAYYDAQYNTIPSASSLVQTWTSSGAEITAIAGSPISSITYVNGASYATLVSVAPHGLTTGRRVVIAGTTRFNGIFAVTVVDDYTFTFDFTDTSDRSETNGTFTDAAVVNSEFVITPAAGWGTYNGYILGTLRVTVDGVSVPVTEIRHAEFVGRSFRLASPASVGSNIVATYQVGDYNVLRMTGMRKGDLWVIESDGKYSNGLISFSLVSGERPFAIGDTLTIEVKSGALEPGDNLVASYIAEGDVNDPEEFFEPSALYRKHGYPSVENTLALGAYLAFLNGARSVVACQAKPTSPTITYDTLLASRSSGDFVGNGGIYYTAHTHGSQSFSALPEEEYGNARTHELMHARDNGNAMTTLHRHEDTNYINPNVHSPYHILPLLGNPYNDNVNFFYVPAGSTTPRQVFLNKVSRSVVMESTVSIPCTRNFGYSCNTSGRTIPSPLNNAGVVTKNTVNNPFFLDSRDPHYLWIYPDGTKWFNGNVEYNPALHANSVGLFNPFVGDSGVPATPVFAYPDEIRNQFSNSGTFPNTPDSTRYTGYDSGTAFPCGALFRLRSGLDINSDFGSSTSQLFTEVDGRPLDSFLNSELAFRQTCTDAYDSVVDHFFKTAYNGGNNDPNNVTIEDAMLYMHTQRDDMSYMILSDNSIILSDRAGLKDGEGLLVHFIDRDDAGFVDPEWAEAARAMESSDAYWIVPLPDAHFSAVQQTFKAHVDAMSSPANRRERQLLTGAFYAVSEDGKEIALKPENLYAGSTNPVAIENIGILEGIQGDSSAEIAMGNIEDVANYGVPENFGNSYRTVYFYPDKIVVGLNGTNVAVPGTYLAAAAGGYLSGQQYLAEPLTWKNLIGFTVTRDRTVITGNPTIANKLGSAGVTVVHGGSAGGRVLHCKSTIVSGNAFQEEPTAVNIADLAAQELRNGLSAQFIGKAQTPDLPHQMLASTKSICQSLMHRKLLNNFDNIQVAQDVNEPRQYNVRVEILPVLPLLWIYIEVQVGL